MPPTKSNRPPPNPSAVARLIKWYVKAAAWERACKVVEVVRPVWSTRVTYYRRINNPQDFTLGELRDLAKALKIPRKELLEAIAEDVLKGAIP